MSAFNDSMVITKEGCILNAVVTASSYSENTLAYFTFEIREGIVGSAVNIYAELCVVASFEFVRKSAKLCYNNFTGELCIDRGYLSPDGVLRAPLYELEIELSDGTPDDLCAYGNKIMAALGLSPESRSKQARARNLK